MGTVVLDNIEKSYEGVVACSEIELSIQKGEFFTLLGPSGCGKTTILRLIAGFIFPDRGTILIDDKDITGLDAEKRKIGMVFQNYALFPFMTVLENVEYGLKVQKKTSKEIKNKSEHYLSMTGLDGFEERKISELSGGEQQRVALARSLAIEPQVLLLDEPLSNLDARLRDKMRAELKLLQKNLGITTIFVTHDQTEALTMSDRIAVLERGGCVQVGTPEEIYTKPVSSFVAGFVGEANLYKLSFRSGEYFISDSLEVKVSGSPQGKYLTIRPQDVVLSTFAGELANTYHGIVIFKQFNGLSTDYIVEVGEVSFQSTILNSIQAGLSFTVGQEVFISFSAESTHILNK